MNKPALFSRYLLFLIPALLLSSLVLPGRYKMPYPQPLGPQFDRIVNQEDVRGISADKPEVVVFGDSFVFFGVDRKLLTKELGVETYTISMPGSASAAWYLIFKNIILEADVLPQYVVIPFHDTILTMPTYRTTGYYFEIVDNYARPHEPLVTQLAYLNAMSPAEKIAEQYLPLYSARWRMRAGLDSRLRYTAPSAFLNCPAPCVNNALDLIFGKQKGVDVTALNSAVDDSQRVLYTATTFNFEEQVGKSFLPAMIQLAQENNVTLVFVPAKTLMYPEYNTEPPGLRSYSKSLAEYLSKQKNVIFINLAHDERIRASYFLDLLHFNSEGKQAFTIILAEELKKIMK